MGDFCHNVQVQFPKEEAYSSAKLVVDGDNIALRALAGTMLHAGSSIHNTKNPTANHSGAPCLEDATFPVRLKKTAMVFDRSRNLGSAVGS